MVSLLVAALLVAAPRVTGMVVIRNTRWDRVQVDVRVGTSPQCNANASVGTKTLDRNRAWAVVSTQVICWRRELVPGDATAGWTAWEQAQVASDAVRDVTL